MHTRTGAPTTPVGVRARALTRILVAALISIGVPADEGAGEAGSEPTVALWAVEDDDDLDAVQRHHGAVLALVDTSRPGAVQDARGAGAAGVLDLHDDPLVIAHATVLVAAGRVVLPADRPEPTVVGLLDAAELRWLRALSRGQLTKDLAGDEGFCEREMYRRLSIAYSKLGVSGRTEAIVTLAKAGLLRRREGDATLLS